MKTLCLLTIFLISLSLHPMEQTKSPYYNAPWVAQLLEKGNDFDSLFKTAKIIDNFLEEDNRQEIIDRLDFPKKLLDFFGIQILNPSPAVPFLDKLSLAQAVLLRGFIEKKVSFSPLIHPKLPATLINALSSESIKNLFSLVHMVHLCRKKNHLPVWQKKLLRTSLSAISIPTICHIINATGYLNIQTQNEIVIIADACHEALMSRLKDPPLLTDDPKIKAKICKRIAHAIITSLHPKVYDNVLKNMSKIDPEISKFLEHTFSDSST